jgi:hypothetical protein
MRRDSGTGSLRVAMMVWISTAHLACIDHARKLGQDAVARRVDNATAVAADQRQNHRLVRLQIADRRGLVLAHEAAVAGDVGGKNGGEPAIRRG